MNSRRLFVQNTALVGVGFSIVPSTVISGLGDKVPRDKWHIVGIGVGGKGMHNLMAMNTEKHFIRVY